MSVCFFVPTEQNAQGSEENAEGEDGETVMVDNTQQILLEFWNKVAEDIKKTTTDDFKTQPLPLARIKKIMKLDEEVKMISAEAPVLFAKAAEIFIHELTLRAWTHTEDNKRRTLQRNDIAMAISKSDQFDFLIDIVPRHETVVPNKPRKEPVRTFTHSDTIHQPSTTVQSPNQQPHIVVQPYSHVVQQPQSSSTPSTSQSSPQQQVVLQQVVTPSGDIQMPIQLTQAQLNMIRLQMQNNNNQPILIQTQSQHPQQIIQVPSQAQQQPQQQVFLQVATTQEAAD